jgi:lysine 6-dehydrogenase
MRMLVLGAGLQGSACAYDLLQDTEVTEVRLAVMSAIPYYFNYDLARLAVEAGVHYCDLGGNTEIVFKQKQLDSEARRKNISVVPDCGLAPGMVNILAEHGIAQLDDVHSVKIYVGGLPQHPEPPLNYMLVYSLEGALDYYTTLSWVLRDCKRTQVPALSEIEGVKFDAPLGELEAFHTAGGLSTMAFRYEGRIPTMEYKTLRYPGHAALMSDIRALGLLDLEPVDVKGTKVVPRDVFIATVLPKLTKPHGHDLVALRVVVKGTKSGEPATKTFELVDRYDEKHGISAMMRTTGYSLSITGLMQVRRQISSAGVHTPDECIPAELYIGELKKRGINIVETS